MRLSCLCAPVQAKLVLWCTTNTEHGLNAVQLLSNEKSTITRNKHAAQLWACFNLFFHATVAKLAVI